MFMDLNDPDPAVIVALEHRLGEPWIVGYDSVLAMWSAFYRSEDGRHRRYIVARTGDELADKAEAGRWAH